MKNNKLPSEGWAEPEVRLNRTAPKVDAEDNILRFLRRNGKATNGTLGASRGICGDCQTDWKNTGVRFDNTK